MIKNKPSSIKTIIILLIIRLVIIGILIIVFNIVKDADPTQRTAAAAIRNVLASRFQLDMTNPAYALGILIGKNLILAVLSILGIVFINSRKFVGSVVITSIDLLIGLASLNPFIPLINLILLLLKKSRDYFKGINKELESEINTMFK